MIRQLFTITPGRSGSHYLYTLMTHVHRVSAYHEPAPNMQGVEMVRWNEGDEAPMKKLMESKVTRIRTITDKGRVLFESNNAFIKGYGWLVPSRFKQSETGVIVLTRDPELVAQSIVRNGWGVGKERDLKDKRNVWLIWPGMARNVLPYAGDGSPIDLARWYAREIYARGEVFKRQFPGITYHEISVDELNDEAKCRAMLAKFGLKPAHTFKGAVGVPTNTSESYATARKI